MESPVTLRLDPETRLRIARIARQKGVSASEIIREAVTVWIQREESAAKPYDAVADLIGVAHGGQPKRSEGAGRQFAALLKKRQGRR